MSSHSNIPTGKNLIPSDLVLKIYSLLDLTPSISTLTKKNRQISATFTTIDRKKTTIDLNVCRPILSSQYRQLPQGKEQKGMEDLIIVWFDQNINKIKENLTKQKIDFREIVNSLEMFDDVGQCLYYIKNIKDEKIFLIISGSFGKAIMNQLNNYSQIYSIYIYSSDERQYKIWSKNYSKIIGIFPTEHQLITQIRKDVSAFYQNNISINVINSIDQDLSKDQTKFIFPRILIGILIRLPQTSQSKDQLIHECRRHYRDNNYQQKKIAEFEKNYNSLNPLLWFTKDSFLYRIINKALRTQNIFYIFKLRFFLIDLYQQLMKIHRKLVKTSKDKIITVYRGQLMLADEFAKLKNNIDGFISINTFLSTSRLSTVALQSAGDGSRRPMFESVYFEIELNFDLNNLPFGDINTIESDNELLICMGTVFRIETVEPLNKSLWYVKLILVNENETKKINNLKHYLIEENNNLSNYLSLGKILQDIEEYDKAQIYYELLLQELPTNHQDISAIYSELGSVIISMKKDSKLAIKYLRQSLTLQLKTFPNNILLFIKTFNSIAEIYVQRRKFQSGLILYQFILEILDHIQIKSKVLEIRADICNQIGYIYSKIGQLSLALKYYKTSLTIKRKILPSDHLKIAVSLNNIGLVYLAKLDSETAEKYLQEANAIQQASLSFEYHPDLAQMYNNLGTMQYSKANLDKALIHFEKALEIQLKYLSSDQSQTALLYNSIANTYLAKKNYQMAFQMYENSLKISQQCWPEFHPRIRELYQNIGSVGRCLRNYERALNSSEKALEIGLKSLPPTHLNLAEIYQEIGRIYSETNNHAMASTNFHKAIDIYIKNPPINQRILGTLYEELGREYSKQEYAQDALRYFRKALEIYQNCKEEESSFVSLYYHFGKAYYQNGEYEDALLNYNKYLQFENEILSKFNFQNLSQTYHAIGETYQTLNYYQMALTNYEKALETIRKDDSFEVSNDKSNLIEKYQRDIQIVKALL